MQNTKLPHSHSITEEKIDTLSTVFNTQSFNSVSEYFKILGDNHRLRIFWLLCHYEECVTNIACFSGMSGPAVCHHLKMLRENGLIICRRDGKEVYYKAAKTQVTKLLHEIVESVLAVRCPENERDVEPYNKKATEKYTQEQIETIKNMHEYLVSNLDKRITIEDLSKRFLMNTTTLKDVFKAVWGTSVAIHVKEHRMKKACELLKTTDKSIGEISLEIGYTSPAKFTEAFKNIYGDTPKNWRKNRKI